MLTMSVQFRLHLSASKPHHLDQLARHRQSTLPCLCSRPVKLHCLGEFSRHHQSTLPCLCSRLVNLHCLFVLSRHRQSTLPCICSSLIIRVPFSHPRSSPCHTSVSIYI